jgi:methionyl-tRNA formyltransferase
LKVSLLATVQVGADLARILSRRGIKIDAVIGLTEREASDAASGLAYMAPVAAEIGAEFVPVETYNLSLDADRERLLAHDVDILIVYGWQRLVPEWLLAHCGVGAIGSHGSAEGISGGRGRSPQNWALILGSEGFSSSIFFLDAGVDSGPVISSRRFCYEETDDIATSYAKSVLVTADMLVDSLSSPDLLESRRRQGAQGAEARYLPQRRPEDGAIDWTRSPSELRRFVAALTRPYPGAFSLLPSGRITVWRARPLTLEVLGASEPPGTILFRGHDESLVVRAGCGLLFIDEYQCTGASTEALRPGTRLASVDFTRQMRTIVERHVARYPDQPLNQAVLRAAGMNLSCDGHSA